MYCPSPYWQLGNIDYFPNLNFPKPPACNVTFYVVFQDGGTEEIVKLSRFAITRTKAEVIRATFSPNLKCNIAALQAGRKKGWAGKGATAPQKRAMSGTPRRFLKENMAGSLATEFDVLCVCIDEEEY